MPAWVAAARLGRHPLPSVDTDRPAVVIAAHPDDEIACGGLIALHRAAGAAVTVVVCTDGSESRAVPGPVAGRSAIRHAEASAAARALDVELVWLGVTGDIHPDVDRLTEQLRPVVSGAMRIYAPSRVDFHPGHRSVAAALARVVAPEAEVRVFAVSVPLGQLATHVRDVTAVEPLVQQAAAAHASQRWSLRAMDRHRRYVAARHRCGRSAEAVWTMTGAAYSGLHAGPPDAWPDAFRGLRPHALTDPMAWWVGRGERDRLRAEAG